MSERLQSSADTLSASVDVNGSSLSFGPVDEVSGIAPPAFHHRHEVRSVNQTFSPDPADPTSPTVEVGAKDLINTASSKGIGVDSVSTQATSDIKSATFSLIENPLSTLAILGLSVSASFIHSESNSSYVFGPNTGSVSGDASFGSLKIGGTLLGGKTLRFSGDVKPNTVIYQKDGVTITLDKQTLSDFLPPTSASTIATPNRITTDAIDISFNNAHLFGQTVTGDIAICQTSADYFTSPIVSPASHS